MPKVSIIVTIYNPKQDYFRICLESIRNQSLQDIEVILIDDGSKKQISDICDEFAIKDRRFKTVHKKNEGVSIASNVGIELAQGEYLTFVDHDDMIDRDMCKVALEEITKNNADVCVWNFESFSSSFSKKASYIGPDYKVYENKEIKNLMAQILDATIYPQQQISLLGANWGKLYRTKMVQEKKHVRFPPGLMGGEDAIFTFRAFSVAEKVIFFNQYLYKYRQSNSSYTKKYKPQMLDDELAMIRIIKFELKGEELWGAYFRMCCNSYISLCSEMILNVANKKTFLQKINEMKEIANIDEYKMAIEHYKELNLKRVKYVFFTLVKKGLFTMAMLFILIYKMKNQEKRDS